MLKDDAQVERVLCHACSRCPLIGNLATLALHAATVPFHMLRVFEFTATKALCLGLDGAVCVRLSVPWRLCFLGAS